MSHSFPSVVDNNFSTPRIVPCEWCYGDGCDECASLVNHSKPQPLHSEFDLPYNHALGEFELQTTSCDPSMLMSLSPKINSSTKGQLYSLPTSTHLRSVNTTPSNRSGFAVPMSSNPFLFNLSVPYLGLPYQLIVNLSPNSVENAKAIFSELYTTISSTYSPSRFVAETEIDEAIVSLVHSVAYSLNVHPQEAEIILRKHLWSVDKIARKLSSTLEKHENRENMNQYPTSPKEKEKDSDEMRDRPSTTSFQSVDSSVLSTNFQQAVRILKNESSITPIFHPFLPSMREVGEQSEEKIECLIPYCGSHAPSKVIRLTCGHVYCGNCFLAKVRSAFQDGVDAAWLECGALQCTNESCAHDTRKGCVCRTPVAYTIVDFILHQALQYAYDETLGDTKEHKNYSAFTDPPYDEFIVSSPSANTLTYETIVKEDMNLYTRYVVLRRRQFLEHSEYHIRCFRCDRAYQRTSFAYDPNNPPFALLSHAITIPLRDSELVECPCSSSSSNVNMHLTPSTISTTMTNGTTFLSPFAKKSFCGGCGELQSHFPLPCSHAYHLSDLGTNVSSDETFLRITTKSCPNCKVLIEKDKRCNHVKCSRCQHHFCWLCKSPWAEHDSQYYKCAAFAAGDLSSTAQKEYRGVIRAAAQAQTEALVLAEAQAKRGRIDDVRKLGEYIEMADFHVFHAEMSGDTSRESNITRIQIPHGSDSSNQLHGKEQGNENRDGYTNISTNVNSISPAEPLVREEIVAPLIGFLTAQELSLWTSVMLHFAVTVDEITSEKLKEELLKDITWKHDPYNVDIEGEQGFIENIDGNMYEDKVVQGIALLSGQRRLLQRDLKALDTALEKLYEALSTTTLLPQCLNAISGTSGVSESTEVSEMPGRGKLNSFAKAKLIKILARFNLYSSLVPSLGRQWAAIERLVGTVKQRLETGEVVLKMLPLAKHVPTAITIEVEEDVVSISDMGDSDDNDDALTKKDSKDSKEIENEKEDIANTKNPKDKKDDASSQSQSQSQLCITGGFILSSQIQKSAENAWNCRLCGTNNHTSLAQILAEMVSKGTSAEELRQFKSDFEKHAAKRIELAKKIGISASEVSIEFCSKPKCRACRIHNERDCRICIPRT